MRINIYKLNILILLILISANIGAQNWTEMTVDIGVRPDIAIFSAGQAHISYISETASNGYVKYAFFDSTRFNITTVQNGYFYAPLDIQLDQFGRPRVVYHDHNSEDLSYATEAGQNWLVEQVASPNHDGWDCSLYIDDNGKNYVSAIDPDSGLEYYSGSRENWVIEVVDDRSIMYGFATSIQKSADGRIHIAYYNNQRNELLYAVRDNGSWHLLKVADNGKFPSMIIDENGNPQIAFYDDFVNSAGYIRVASMESNAWHFENIDTLSNVSLGFNGARHLLDYKYVNGEYHLAYSDKKIVNYAKRLDNNWRIEAVKNYRFDASITLGQQTGLAIDDDNNIHIVYYEKDTTIPEGGRIKYVFRSGVSKITLECPPSVVYKCVADTSVATNGSPNVLFNPGTSISISHTDSLVLSSCAVTPDTLFRNWLVGNELGNISRCVQIIETKYFTAVQFPSDKEFFNLCYSEIDSTMAGQIEGLCDNVKASYIDSLISTSCTNFIELNRFWTIEDQCGNILSVDTQFIKLTRAPSPEIINLEITPDDGTSNGMLSFDIECGIPEFQYFWSNGTSSSAQNNLSAGTYSVTINDAINCRIIQSFEIPKLTDLSTTVLSGNIKDASGKSFSDYNLTIKSLDSTLTLFDCPNSTLSFEKCITTSDTILGTVEICISKDDSHSARLSSLDVAKTRKLILGLVADPCFYDLQAADINNSNSITGFDLIQIIKVILGLKVSFDDNPAWIFFREETQITCDTIDISNNGGVNIEYIAVKRGDISCEK